MQVSIITVAWNSAATITDTLRSVLSQTYKDIDYWVIDGLSTDGTIEIVRQWQPRFNGRLHLISEKDAGLYDAMNKGIRHCTGDIVGILNSDDFFTSDTVIQTVVDSFSDGIDAVYGDVHFVNAENLDKTVRYYSSSSFRPAKMRFGYMPAHPSFYARREVFDRCGLYSLDFKLAADYEMMVRLFCKYKIKAQYIQKDFVTMRTGGMSNSSIRNRLLLTKEDARACRENGVYSNFFLCSFKYFTKVFEFLR